MHAHSHNLSTRDAVSDDHPRECSKTCPSSVNSSLANWELQKSTPCCAKQEPLQNPMERRGCAGHSFLGTRASAKQGKLTNPQPPAVSPLETSRSKHSLIHADVLTFLQAGNNDGFLGYSYV